MSGQNMFSWYNELYPDVENSATYSKYCNLVFGKDFSQQGFSDFEQINFMLSKLDIKTKDKVLEIGCGTGKLSEYIYGLTNAEIIGVDYSQTAIQIAKERTREKHGLSFLCSDMDEMSFPVSSFDIIYSIDAIFFSKDLPKLLLKLNKLLKDNGKLIICYSEIRFDEKVSIENLLPQNTQVGQAFEKVGLTYQFFNLTDYLYKHMLLKRRIALALKEEFVVEGKEYLFDYIFRESIPVDMSLSTFKDFQARYLYLYEKLRCSQ